MKIVGLAIIFHLTTLLILREDGLPSLYTSPPSLSGTNSTHLLVVIAPGLTLNHGAIFSKFGWQTHSIGEDAKSLPDRLMSFFSGRSADPMLPCKAETVFDHVSATVYSGMDEFTWTDKENVIKVPINLEWEKRAPRSFEEIDAFKEFTSIPGKLPWEKNTSTMFLLALNKQPAPELTYEFVQNLSAEILYLSEYVDIMCGSKGTNFILLSDSNLMVLGGPAFSQDANFTEFNAWDVAPLISSLLNVSIPLHSEGQIYPHIFTNGTMVNGLLKRNVEQLYTVMKEKTQVYIMYDIHTQLEIEVGNRLSMNLTIEEKDLEQLMLLYQEVKTREDLLHFYFTIFLTSLWVTILLLEIFSTRFAIKHPISKYASLAMHILIVMVLIISGLTPLAYGLPAVYSLYMIVANMFLVKGVTELSSVMYFMKDFHVYKIHTYFLYVVVVALLAEYSFQASNFDIKTIHVGLCILVIFPALQRFAESPHMTKTGWWFSCLVLLGSLHIPTLTYFRFLNLSGTILICASGFGCLWVNPLRNKVLSILNTAALALAIFVQALSKAPSYKTSVKFVAIPLLLFPCLPLLTTKTKSSRFVITIFSVGVLMVLTSRDFEPIWYFFIALTTCLWCLMENFYVPQKLGTEEVRRAVLLGIIILTTATVTRTSDESYEVLGYNSLLPVFQIYRQTMMLTVLSTVFHTLMPHETHHTYMTYVVLFIAIGLGSLRATLTSTDPTQLHKTGVAIGLSYFLGKAFAIHNSDATLIEPNKI